jgi:putative transposase
LSHLSISTGTDRTKWLTLRDRIRSKTVITDTGPTEISVPRDREAAAADGQGNDHFPAAKRLTYGAICANLAEFYGAEVSKQAISTIAGWVINDLAEQAIVYRITR